MTFIYSNLSACVNTNCRVRARVGSQHFAVSQSFSKLKCHAKLFTRAAATYYYGLLDLNQMGWTSPLSHGPQGAFKIFVFFAILCFNAWEVAFSLSKVCLFIFCPFTKRLALLLMIFCFLIFSHVRTILQNRFLISAQTLFQKGPNKFEFDGYS